jgi:ATP-dependent Clp protease ATP-binding subunit ClpA
VNLSLSDDDDFLRLSEPARAAYGAARAEAISLDRPLATIHLLAGLLADRAALVARALAPYGLDRQAVVGVFAWEFVGSGKVATGTARWRRTPALAEAIEVAHHHARARNAKEVRSTDLLFGLVRVDRRLASHLAVQFTVDEAAIASALTRQAAIEDREGEWATAPVPLGGELRRTVGAARRIARRLRCDRTATEHLMLASLADLHGPAAVFLRTRGAHPGRVRTRVFLAISPGGCWVRTLPELSSGSITALEHAACYSALARRVTVEAPELMLAIASGCTGPAGSILRDNGIEPAKPS